MGCIFVFGGLTQGRVYEVYDFSEGVSSELLINQGWQILAGEGCISFRDDGNDNLEGYAYSYSSLLLGPISSYFLIPEEIADIYVSAKITPMPSSTPNIKTTMRCSPYSTEGTIVCSFGLVESANNPNQFFAELVNAWGEIYTGTEIIQAGHKYLLRLQFTIDYNNYYNGSLATLNIKDLTINEQYSRPLQGIINILPHMSPDFGPHTWNRWYIHGAGQAFIDDIEKGTGKLNNCPESETDFNSDCIVNMSDFVILAENWLN
ncbi:MAG: hypothetical protein A2Y13_07790 [Planctomycetes bacterium GWC2_45_44]|nr:MAG: hypothetical protein A2Y13_07790 [Planctomycetes bacterium GWC2_45_44]